MTVSSITYVGEKHFAETRSIFTVVIIEHADYEVVEVAAWNNLIKREAPRIYLDLIRLKIAENQYPEGKTIQPVEVKQTLRTIPTFIFNNLSVRKDYHPAQGTSLGVFEFPFLLQVSVVPRPAGLKPHPYEFPATDGNTSLTRLERWRLPLIALRYSKGERLSARDQAIWNRFLQGKSQPELIYNVKKILQGHLGDCPFTLQNTAQNLVIPVDAPFPTQSISPSRAASRTTSRTTSRASSRASSRACSNKNSPRRPKSLNINIENNSSDLHPTPRLDGKTQSLLSETVQINAIKLSGSDSSTNQPTATTTTLQDNLFASARRGDSLHRSLSSSVLDVLHWGITGLRSRNSSFVSDCDSNHIGADASVDRCAVKSITHYHKDDNECRAEWKKRKDTIHGSPGLFNKQKPKPKPKSPKSNNSPKYVRTFDLNFSKTVDTEDDYGDEADTEKYEPSEHSSHIVPSALSSGCGSGNIDQLDELSGLVVERGGGSVGGQQEATHKRVTSSGSFFSFLGNKQRVAPA